MRIDGINERVRGYGWLDDGSDIVGHYVTTENHTLYFCKQGGFKRKEVLV